MDRFDVTPAACAVGRKQAFSGIDDTPISPTEYSRLLHAAHRVSLEKLWEYVETMHTPTLLEVVAPALVNVVRKLHSAGSDLAPVLVDIVRTIASYGEARVPNASTSPPPTLRIHGGLACCQHCHRLQSFLSSESGQTLWMPLTKAERFHIHSVIEAYCSHRVTHVPEPPITLVVTKRSTEVDWKSKAVQALAGDSSSGAITTSASSFHSRQRYQYTTNQDRERQLTSQDLVV